MSEVKWIKICTDIFDDEKILLIEAMPDAYAIITAWFKLLCLAGKQNNSGVFMMNEKIAYTDEMLATIFRMPVNTVRLSLKTFEQFGMIEIIDGVITIPNWGKHQSLERIEKLKDYQREYHREYRQKQKQLTDGSKLDSKVYVNNTDIDIEEDTDKENNNPPISPHDDDAFETFWKAYPKKSGKGEARKAFKKIKGVRLQTMLDAIERQKKSAQWKKDGGQYIPMPSTWLNQERWDDELPEDERRDMQSVKRVSANTGLYDDEYVAELASKIKYDN